MSNELIEALDRIEAAMIWGNPDNDGKVLEEVKRLISTALGRSCLEPTNEADMKKVHKDKPQ